MANKRKGRAVDPLAGPRHPRFGATKAQGKQFAATRALKNRIHELEQKAAADSLHLAHQTKVITELQNRLVAAKPTKAQLAAMRSLCQHVGYLEALRLGVLSELLEIARWLMQLDGHKVTQSGANVLEYIERVRAEMPDEDEGDDAP